MQLSSAILQEQVLLQQQQATTFQLQQNFLQQQQHPHLHLHFSPLNSPLSSPLTSPLSSPQGYFFQESDNNGNKILMPSSTIFSGNNGVHLDLSNYGQSNMGATSVNNSQHIMLQNYQVPSKSDQNNFSAVQSSFSSRKASEQLLPTISRSHSKLDPTSNGLSKKKSSQLSLNNQLIPENQICEQPRSKYLQAREEHYRKLLQRLPIVKISFTSYQDILFHWENVKGHIENVPGGIAILVSLPYMQQVKIDLVPIKNMTQTIQEKLCNFWKLFGFSTNNSHLLNTSEREEDGQLNYLDDTEESVVIEHRQQKKPLPSLFSKRPSKVKELDSKSAKNVAKQNSLDDILKKDIATSSISQRLLLRIHAQRAPRMLQTLQPDSLDRPYNLEYHGEFEVDFRLPPSLLHWFNQRISNPLSEEAWMELLSKRCLSHRYNKHTGLLVVYIDEIRTRRFEDDPLPAVKSPQPQSVPSSSEPLLNNTAGTAASSLKPPLSTDNSNKIAIQKSTNTNAPPANTNPLPSTSFQPLPPTNFSPDGFVLSPSSNVKTSLPLISDAKINDIVTASDKKQNISNNNSNNNMLDVSESQRLSPEIPILSNPDLYYDDYSSVSSSDYEEDEEDIEDTIDRDNNEEKGDDLPPNIPSTPHKENLLSSSKPPMPPSSSNKTKKKLSKAEIIIAKEQQRRKKYSALESSPHRKKKSNVANNAHSNNKSSNHNILTNLFPSFSSPSASSAKTFHKNVSNNSMKSNNTSTNNMSQTTSNNSSNNTSHNNISSHNTSNSNMKSHNTSHNNIQNTSDNNITISDKPVSHSQLTEGSRMTPLTQHEAREDTKNRVYVRSVSQPAAVHRPQLIGEFVPKQLSPLSNPRLLSVSNKTRSTAAVQNETASSAATFADAGVDPGLTMMGKKSPLPLLKQSLHNMYRSRPSDTETQQGRHHPLENDTDVFQADRYEDLYLGAMSFDDEEIQYKHYSPQMMASFSRSEDDFGDDY